MGKYEPLQTPRAAATAPLRPTAPHLRAVDPSEPSAVLPGGAGRRFFALLIDNMVMSLLTFPAFFAIVFAIQASDPNSGLMATMQSKQGMINLIYYALMIPLTVLYYGWFYKNKGATPGKLALGLKVVDAKTGAHIGYSRAFLRETLGRVLDIVPLFAGLIVGLVRSDKRCFHDLVVGTQVVRRK